MRATAYRVTSPRIHRRRAAGMHLHFPGFARMTKAGGTFALLAD
jgi:hypothetical protein